MKRIVNNESGYTLLLVFGIIMMLMIFMFSFTRIAVTQNKQVVKTDSSIVTSALAEMGGEYFKEYVKADIAKRVAQLEAEVNALIANDTLSDQDKHAHIESKINAAEQAMKAHYSSLTTTVGTSKEIATQTGYTLVDYEMPNDQTIYYVTQGYESTNRGILLQVEIHLPAHLMWKSDTPTFQNSSLSFADYVATTENNFATLNQLTINESTSGYKFIPGEFYYLPENTEFSAQQFNDNQSKSLTDIKVYSANDIQFKKHVKISGTTIVTNSLGIEFESTAQGEIVNSTIVAKDFTVTYGDKKVTFSNSYICFTGINKPLNLHVDPAKNSSEIDPNPTVDGLLDNLDFQNGAKIVYQSEGSYYVMTSPTSVSNASSEDLARCSPTISGKVATYGYDSFKSEEIDYESIVYN